MTKSYNPYFSFSQYTELTEHAHYYGDNTAIDDIPKSQVLDKLVSLYFGEARDNKNIEYGPTVECTKKCIFLALAQGRADMLEQVIIDFVAQSKIRNEIRSEIGNKISNKISIQNNNSNDSENESLCLGPQQKIPSLLLPYNIYSPHEHFYGGDLAGFACFFKNEAVLLSLIQRGYDINQPIIVNEEDPHFKYYLHYLHAAIEKNDPALFDMLLRLGAEIHVEDMINYSVLVKVFISTDRDIYFSILEKNYFDPQFLHYKKSQLVNLFSSSTIPTLSSTLTEPTFSQFGNIYYKQHKYSWSPLATCVNCEGKEINLNELTSIPEKIFPLATRILHTYSTLEHLAAFQKELAHAHNIMCRDRPVERHTIEAFRYMRDYTQVLLEKLILRQEIVNVFMDMDIDPVDNGVNSLKVGNTVKSQKI